MLPGAHGMAAVLSLLASAAMAEDAKLVFVAPITLAPGHNWIEHFAPDGRPAHVIMGLHVDGKEGALIYMVMLRSDPGAGGADWQIAGIETAPWSGVFADTIVDKPVPGGMSLSVLFEHMTLDGKPETIMRTVDAHGLVSRCNAMVTVTKYRLVHEDKPRPVDRFKTLSQSEERVECVP